jgi:carotene isomerase
MQILNDAVISDRYDVIVVGAGIGGLTAAALLGKRGLRPLVIEQHYLPGGLCTAMRRQDFTFDVGPQLMYGFEKKGYNPHRFVMNEIEEEIDMIPHEYVYRMRLLGTTITFWRDFERFVAELVALFPHEEEGIRALFDYMYRIYDAVMGDDVMPMPPTEVPREAMRTRDIKDLEALQTAARMMNEDSRSLIDRFISDPQVIHFFDIMAATFTSCDLKDTPAILTTTMFIDNHAGGTCYAADTPQMLSNLLEKAIEKYGGQMLYRHCVDEILIANGSAYGVRLTDGTTIEADRIVSNATVWNLYGKLIRPEHIDLERMRWAQAFEPTFGFLVLYLGVDAEVIPDDLGHVEMFVLDASGFEGRGNFNIELPSREDPARCPPGTHALTVVSPNQLQWPSAFDPEYQSETYQRMKEEETNKVLDRMEQFLPGLRKHIRVMEVGTPTTVERYTLRNWGNLGGPKPSMGQHMLNRPHAQSDWEKLFLVGDSTVMGEGVVATTASGVGAANLILRDLEMEEYLPRPFPRQYIKFTPGKPWTEAPDRSEPITPDVAQRLAKQCQLCEDPPCTRDCPASVDVPGFTRRIESANYAGAARSLRETNPLSEICGYICPAEQMCEKHCRRLEFSDGPVRIAELQAWVCGQASKQGWDRHLPERGDRRVAVVGAGPAGLSCAHYLARLGARVEIFDKASRPGGMLSHAVPTFRLPKGVMEREIDGLTGPGMEFRFGKALGRDVAISDLEREFDAIFLAPGLWSGRRLELPGLEPGMATDALTWLREARETDRVAVGSRVLVIGGGSVASDAALTAMARGADAVTVVCLEEPDTMPALASEVERMKAEGIEIEAGWGPLRVLDGSKVHFARCTSVFDETGRFAPSLDESTTLERDFDQLILAVGQDIEPELADHLQRELGSAGPIQVDPESLQLPDRPKLFAGGDIIRGGGTAVEAAADGRRAATAIHARLGEK